MNKAAIEGVTNMMMYVLAIIVIINSVMFALNITNEGLVSGTTDTTRVSRSITDQPSGNATNTKYLQITNHSFYEDLLFTTVNGTVINNSNNTVNSVEIDVQFYNENGEMITSKSGKARSVILAPGENSSFNVRADVGEEIVHSYNIIPGGDIGEA